MFSWYNPIPNRQSHVLSLSSLYLLLLLVLALLAPFCMTTPAFAAASPITINSQIASTVFSKDIDFQVNVSDTDSAITQATLIITIQKPTYSQQTYTVPVTTPGKSLQLSYQDDISGNNFLFSGTPLTYAWMFHDQNDHWLTGNRQSYTVIDNRFQWQHLSQDELQVEWYGQGTDFGQIVLSQALDNIKRISANLGSGPTSPMTLWVYHSSDDFRGALPPNTFEWVGGLAYPPLNEAFVVVNGPDDTTLVRDMPHELTHVIFHELVPLTDLVPTWFDEGLAVYNQMYHEPEMKQRFDDALASHNLLRFDTLTAGFPADSDKAYLAYAQSWNFISYMYSTFGTAKMAHLIQLMHRGSNAFEFQVTSALGEDSTEIENQWLISLHQPAILTPSQPTPQSGHSTNIPTVTLSDTSAPWLIGLGVLLVLLALSGASGLFIYQYRNTRIVSSVKSAPTASPVSSHAATATRYTSNIYVPAVSQPDTFEQYTLSSIPYFDAAARPVNSMESSYADASLRRTLPLEQAASQPAQTSTHSGQGKHSASPDEKHTTFTFGQEYTDGQREQQVLKPPAPQE